MDDNGEPCIIYINASVLAFPFINTVNLKFTADFYLNLRWYDLRLGFMDLNNVTYLNTLTKEDKNSIWVPTLSFLNALGPYSTVVDESTSGVLVRLGKPLPEEISLTQEGKYLLTIFIDSINMGKIRYLDRCMQRIHVFSLLFFSYALFWKREFYLFNQRIFPGILLPI